METIQQQDNQKAGAEVLHNISSAIEEAWGQGDPSSDVTNKSEIIAEESNKQENNQSKTLGRDSSKKGTFILSSNDDAKKEAATSDEKNTTKNETPAPESDYQAKYNDLESKYKKLYQEKNKSSRTLSAVKKKLESYAKEDAITPDEAADLYKTLDGLEIPTEQEEQHSVLQDYYKVWHAELNNMRKYVDDKEIDNKAIAFENFLYSLAPQEQDQLLQQFKNLDEVAMTRKMLEIGSDYLPTYKAIQENGNIKNLVNSKDKAIQEQQKTIDNLQKELLQYKNTGYLKNNVPSVSTDTIPSAVRTSEFDDNRSPKTIGGIIESAYDEARKKARG